MEIRQITISFMVVGLFIISLIMFSIGLTSDNGASNSIIQDPRVSEAFGNLNRTIINGTEVSNQIKNTFQEDNPIFAFGNLILLTIVNGGKLLVGLTLGVFIIISTLVFDVIGINPIVFSVISAGLLITLILLAWRLYSTGQ